LIYFSTIINSILRSINYKLLIMFSKVNLTSTLVTAL
jgi:hypothetical protein